MTLTTLATDVDDESLVIIIAAPLLAFRVGYECRLVFSIRFCFLTCFGSDDEARAAAAGHFAQLDYTTTAAKLRADS